MNKINLETIENTGNKKYANLFENPTYEEINEEKIIRKAEERKEAKAKQLVKKKNTNGFISPIFLGLTISILIVLGAIIMEIAYLVA